MKSAAKPQPKSQLYQAVVFGLGCALLFFLLNHFSMLLIFSRPPNRFESLTLAQIWQLLTHNWFFELRIVFLHLIVGAWLGGAALIFNVRRRKRFAFLFALTIFCQVYVAFPHTFDFIPLIYPVLRETAPWVSAGWYLAALGILFVFLFGQRRKSRRPPYSLALCWIWLGLFLWAQWPSLQNLVPGLPPSNKPAIDKSQLAHDKKNPHIFLVMMDGMNPADFEAVLPDGGSALTQFISHASVFENTFSSLAQTHGALLSVLTGNSPPFSGIRSNLPDQILDPHFLPQNSLLEDFKKRGYQVVYLTNVMEFSYFRDSDWSGRVIGPKGGIVDIWLGTIFKDFLTYSIFNNALGRSVMPEMFGSASFPQGSTDEGLLKRFVETYNQADLTRPTVFVIHNCQIHWPLQMPFPFYPREDLPDDRFSPIAYGSKLSFGTIDKKKEGRTYRREFDARIYQFALRKAARDFLNPLFEIFKENGFFENAIVGLFSDHGEDFLHQPDRFPKLHHPSHGAHLMNSSRSEKTYLALSIPGLEPKRISQPAGLIDLLPTIMDYIGLPTELKHEGRSLLPEIHGDTSTTKPYYTETGIWFGRSFPDELTSYFSEEKVPFIFKIDFPTNTLSVAPEFKMPVVLNKQRALSDGVLRYTVYWAAYGQGEFLCNLILDRSCQQNLIATSPRTNEFRRLMRTYLEKDIQTGAIPPLVFDQNNRPHAVPPSADAPTQAKNWGDTLYAFERWYAQFDIRPLLDVAKNLTGKIERWDERRVELVLSTLARYCRSGGLANNTSDPATFSALMDLPLTNALNLGGDLDRCVPENWEARKRRKRERLARKNRSESVEEDDDGPPSFTSLAELKYYYAVPLEYNWQINLRHYYRGLIDLLAKDSKNRDIRPELWQLWNSPIDLRVAGQILEMLSILDSEATPLRQQLRNPGEKSANRKDLITLGLKQHLKGIYCNKLKDRKNCELFSKTQKAPGHALH